jgi:type I restriction enzyme S subunit
MDTEVGIGSTEYAVLSPRTDRIDPWLLYYLSKSYPVHNYAVSRMRGSTGRQRVPFSVFRRELDIPLPPLSEQRKIATVLYTVDQAIQKIEEIVEQTERTKQALMQTLFLDGYYTHNESVDVHHRNRLPRHPAEWETKSAEAVIDVTRGSHPRPKNDASLWGGDIPIIKISDRNRGDSRTITSTGDTVTEKGSRSSKMVDEGTLIVSNAGTVGAARITGMETCIHDHWLILRSYDANLTTRYLYYFINWNQNFLESLASGSTVLDLNTDDFRLFDITIPSLDEQEKITDSLDSLHDQKMSHIRYANQLQRLRQGLMQDLLSGMVRTHEADIDIPDEILAHG